ncbi:MAG TPA: MOSC N-terminal beta barrel domain-containing protein [Alicycliphilus sp.]|nr:MOSC N-terminal beta barrel domain-containing protein [Alicycliphilus sp.]
MNEADSNADGHLGGLFLHPVKSCAGIAVREALVIETGLDLDRAWMVVDEQGEMLTQRELPRMALVQATLGHSDLVLRAPGMLALHIRLDTVEQPTRVRVWNDLVKAYDMGPLAAQWFSDFLGRRLRLARFDPEEKRFSDANWTGALQAENAFSDGFPLLVASQASLDDLNRRLAAQGHGPVGMERFRPNLVLHGLQAWDEDHVHEIDIATDEGPVTLRLVKPCSRCSIPNIDPVSAEATAQPGQALAGFRADARLQGAITFGMNAVVVRGLDCTLRVGQAVHWRFDFQASRSPAA